MYHRVLQDPFVWLHIDQCHNYLANHHQMLLPILLPYHLRSGSLRSFDHILESVVPDLQPILRSHSLYNFHIHPLPEKLPSLIPMASHWYYKTHCLNRLYYSYLLHLRSLYPHSLLIYNLLVPSSSNTLQSLLVMVILLNPYNSKYLYWSLHSDHMLWSVPSHRLLWSPDNAWLHSDLMDGTNLYTSTYAIL